jgi:hypothetical protein
MIFPPFQVQILGNPFGVYEPTAKVPYFISSQDDSLVSWDHGDTFTYKIWTTPKVCGELAQNLIQEMWNKPGLLTAEPTGMRATQGIDSIEIRGGNSEKIKEAKSKTGSVASSTETPSTVKLVNSTSRKVCGSQIHLGSHAPRGQRSREMSPIREMTEKPTAQPLSVPSTAAPSQQPHTPDSQSIPEEGQPGSK